MCLAMVEVASATSRGGSQTSLAWRHRSLHLCVSSYLPHVQASSCDRLTIFSRCCVILRHHRACHTGTANAGSKNPANCCIYLGFGHLGDVQLSAERVQSQERGLSFLVTPILGSEDIWLPATK